MHQIHGESNGDQKSLKKQRKLQKTGIWGYSEAPTMLVCISQEPKIVEIYASTLLVVQGNILIHQTAGKPQCGHEIAQKVEQTKNMLNMRAFEGPLPTPYVTHRSLKQFKYMSVPGRYLRETFECIGQMGNISLGLKRPQKLQKWQICSFRALWKQSESSFVFHKCLKQLKYMPAPSRHLKETLGVFIKT